MPPEVPKRNAQNPEAANPEAAHPEAPGFEVPDLDRPDFEEPDPEGLDLAAPGPGRPDGARPDATPPEFSRPLALGRVGHEGRTEQLVATEAERAALARRFGIPAVRALRATLRLTPEPDGAVLAKGRITAEVTQDCIVTLDPVEQRVEEAIAFRLLPSGREPAEGPDEIDEIETAHDVADLGEAVAEQLALALDPYPRAPEAVLPPEAQDGPDNPFAALAALRRKN